jgi:hypothetical protein
MARPWITRGCLLPQAWRQHSAISLLLFAVGFKALERLEMSLTMLTMLTILEDEWRTNGVQNLAVKPSRDGQRLLSTLQSSGKVSGLQTMEKFDNSLQFSSPTMAELLFVYICHRFGLIGKRSAADKSLRLPANTEAFSSLSPSTLRPAQG